MDVIHNCFYSSLPVVKAVAETVMRYYVVEYHANAHLTNHEDENWTTDDYGGLDRYNL